MGRPAVQIDYAGGQFTSALGGEDNYCDRCSSRIPDDVPLIFIDTSDGEYGGLGICRPCIESMWAEVADLQREHMPRGGGVLITEPRE